MAIDPAYVLAWPAFLFSITVHEWAHARVAERLGDATARECGRCTLSPFAHMSVAGTWIVPGVLAALHSPVLIGWGRRPPLDAARLGRPHDDHARVALAGPVANLVLGIAFAMVYRLLPAGERGASEALRSAAALAVMANCGLALFHLIPIPPLDGAGVLMRFIRLRHVIALHRFRLAGFAVLGLALVLMPAARGAALAPVRGLAGACVTLVGGDPGGLAP